MSKHLDTVLGDVGASAELCEECEQVGWNRGFVTGAVCGVALSIVLGGVAALLLFADPAWLWGAP